MKTMDKLKEMQPFTEAAPSDYNQSADFTTDEIKAGINEMKALEESVSDTSGNLPHPVFLNLLRHIPYENYKAALGQINVASDYHWMCRIIGHPGSGKTTLLLEANKQNPNAVYICIPKRCGEKDLLSMVGGAVGYYPKGTVCQSILDLISHLNTRGKDTVFLIDETDNLCPKSRGQLNNIDKLDILRYIWDYTKLHTAFIFAAPYDLEHRLQKSSDDISNSQFYRRCSIHTMAGMPTETIVEFLNAIEQDFPVSFAPNAKDALSKRISAVDRGGLGITVDIISKCLMIALPGWKEYYLQICRGCSREEALKAFRGQERVDISQGMVANVMMTQR